MSAARRPDLRLYVASRERVLGARRLHRDPHVAARQLVDELGRHGAERWAARLLAALVTRESA